MTPRRLRVLATAVVMLVAATGLFPLSGANFSDATSNDGNTFTAAVLNSAFRVTTYEIRTGEFTGTTYTMPLGNPLVQDYFVVLRGGAGNGSGLAARLSSSPRATGSSCVAPFLACCFG